MQILLGRRCDELDEAELHRRIEAAERVVIDVGTGDGRGAYRRACLHPSWLVIGLDPAADRMAATAAKAARKPSKGGCANLLFVVGTAEQPPSGLIGQAHEVTVDHPWAGLLRGVVRGDPPVLRGLGSLLRPGGRLEVVIGTDIWREPVPSEVAGLPRLTASDASGALRERYADAGLSLETIDTLARDDIERFPTSWGRRVRAGRPDSGFVTLRAHALPTS